MRIILLFFIPFIMLNNTTLAQEKYDHTHFQNMPIMHEGRLKPIDSFARIILKQISGQTNLGTMNALDWLTLTIFDPQTATEIPVFKIKSKSITKKLELTPKDGLYSLTQIKTGLKNTNEDIQRLLQKESLTKNEQDLIQLHENAATLTLLMRSFSALLPLDIVLPEHYQENIQNTLNFAELTKIEQRLESDVKELVSRKGTNTQAYSPEELSIAKASFNLQALRAGGKNNKFLRVIPTSWDAPRQDWVSPWAIILEGEGSPSSAFLMSQWTDLANAYRRGDTKLWQDITKDLLDETLLEANAKTIALRFNTERIYRSIQPYNIAMALYALTIIMLIISKKRQQKAKQLAKSAWLCALSGLTIHVSALIARIYILDRPPVGTLYESILFVTALCAAIGIILSTQKRTLTPLLIGVLSALGLLTIAPAFQQSADNLEVLVAVLNSGFWLTTHVLCITAGYAVCVFTAGMAHTQLYVKAFKTKGLGNQQTEKLKHSAYIASLWALFLTTIGTVLGGIWADQSWGRFWGWDPKENGALLIVLWLIWLHHGRISKKLNDDLFMALLCALNIIVMISWFGVNLLNVGLHSYGFISGIAGGLGAFCILQLSIILWLFIYARKERSKV